jgi:hypothetical protein
MLADTDDYELLTIKAAAGFVMSDSGRLLLENAPDQSAAPRLYLTGCRSGNILRLRRQRSRVCPDAIIGDCGDKYR